MYKRDCMQ